MIRILELLGVALRRKVQECCLETKYLIQSHLAFRFNDGGAMFMKQRENVDIARDFPWVAACKIRQTIHHGDYDRIHVHLRFQVLNALQKCFEGHKVEFVWKDLNDTLHEILLGNHVFAVNSDFEKFRQYNFGVHFHVDPFHFGKPNQCSTHQLFQVSAFLFALYKISERALVLHPDPQFVHFPKILQHKFHRILHISTISFVLRSGVGKFVTGYLRQVVAQEKASHWVLNSTT
mmetsp:Transcript_18081/g.44325  ORF Transcript_18081/g.44325 Transcript_18081/m.44325 type:complete len:234 (+) Transcript_18081:1334-2035(+)